MTTQIVKKSYKRDRSEKLKKLGFETYREYLMSELWKTIRSRVLTRDGNQCQKCQRRAEQVHHQAYHLQTLNGNDDTWLISLCRDCHHILEFDGERKRTWKEVCFIQKQWFKKSMSAAKRARRELKQKRKREAEVIKRNELMSLPITDKQRIRLSFLSRQLGIKADELASANLTRNDFHTIQLELSGKIRQVEIQKRAEIDRDLASRMTAKPAKENQKSLL